MLRPHHLDVAAEGFYRFTRSTDGRNSLVQLELFVCLRIYARVAQVKACARRKAGLAGKRSLRCCYGTATHAADRCIGRCYDGGSIVAGREGKGR